MESTRLSRMSAGMVCCLIVLPASAAFAQQNTVTFDNKSGEPALAKLVGPTQQAVEVPNGRTATVNVKAGEYYILVRYGTSGADYSYSRGERFHVRETMTQYSAVSITLHKVVGGDYQTRRISRKEFTDTRIPKEDTTETSSPAAFATEAFSLTETVAVHIDKADLLWLQTADALPVDSRKLLSAACAKANDMAIRLEKLVGKDVGSAVGVPAYEGTALSGTFTRFLALRKFPIGLLSQLGAGKEVTTEHAELKKELEANGVINAWEQSQQARNAIQDLIRRLRETTSRSIPMPSDDSGTMRQKKGSSTGAQSKVQEKKETPLVGVIFYVDKDNRLGPWDGRSWATAFPTIQNGINAAAQSSGGDVWVAEGVYDEERTSDMHAPPVDTGSLQLKENVHLYGGFAGTETSRSHRNWQIHQTVIDGSKARSSQASYHVIVGADKTTLDGFTVTGGKASAKSGDSGLGGGMFNSNSSMTIANCTFETNLAVIAGGAMYNHKSSIDLRRCMFIGNSAIIKGGAIANAFSSLVGLTCAFINNRAGLSGAGMDCTGPGRRDVLESRSVVQLYNCTFTKNKVDVAPQADGGISGGGAIHVSGDSHIQVGDCIFWDNSPDEIRKHFYWKTTVKIYHSAITGSHAGDGNISADPLFVDPAGSDLRLRRDSPCIDTGNGLFALDTDIFGSPRPQGKRVDMGACEFTPAGTP